MMDKYKVGDRVVISKGCSIESITGQHGVIVCQVSSFVFEVKLDNFDYSKKGWEGINSHLIFSTSLNHESKENHET